MAFASFEIKYINPGGSGTDYGNHFSNYYKSPVNSERPLTTESVEDFAEYVHETVRSGTFFGIDGKWQSVQITDASLNIVYEEKVELQLSPYGYIHTTTINGQTTTEEIPESTVTDYSIPAREIALSSGTFELTYKFKFFGQTNDYYQAKSIFSAVENKYPLKKWTITDVINRIFDTVTPLRYGEKPKFRLQGVNYNSTTGNVSGLQTGSLAEKLEQIIAPEFSFPKMTLREMLQQVGGYIHAEPRIVDVHIDNGKIWYEVGFDFYGGTEKSKIGSRQYVSASFSYDINNYATGLDSHAENLVNRINYLQGVNVEPFNQGFISLRTETTAIRLTDDNNSFIPTSMPIDRIVKVNMVWRIYPAAVPTFKTDDQGNIIRYDITPYLFENADYQNLSSFEGTYPYCKAYAFYYTQGQKNIKGLFFKNPNAISGIFSKYAIVNILEAVTGGEFNYDGDTNKLLEQCFEITYQPVKTARVRTNKALTIGGIPRVLNYNQGANLIETRFYGENLKGVLARLGNVDKTYTYHLSTLSQVPRIGMLFDDEYYISAVNVEYLPSYIRCTVALSKDFNRLSQYIGISSDLRMWEISEKQAQQRETVMSEYLVVEEKAGSTPTSDNNVLFTDKSYIAYYILNHTIEMQPISAMEFRTYSKSGTANQPEGKILPVSSVAMGNTMSFRCACQDNYSVGQKLAWETVQGGVSGYWGVFVPYTDYYGRFYWMNFRLKTGNAVSPLALASGNYPNNLPQGELTGGYTVIETGDFSAITKAFRNRHDSREIATLTYELIAVGGIGGKTYTQNDTPRTSADVIIGSALMENCCLVNSTPNTYVFYGFTHRINPISRVLDVSDGIDLSSYLTGNEIQSASVIVPDVPESVGLVAWALITTPGNDPITVEDEDGTVIEQNIPKGAEVLLAQNTAPHGQELCFTVKKDIYE